METERIKKKLYNTLKLSGFSVRRELCSYLVDKLAEEGITIQEPTNFDLYLAKLIKSLESQCLAEQSIEKVHIERALEACFSTGYEKHETVFNVISAFEFPKFTFNLDRKLYFPSTKKLELLPGADAKAEIFQNRYNTILQRTRRNFTQKLPNEEENPLKLQTIDYLLTLTNATLDRTLILGSLLQVSEGKFYLEDPTGIVLLDLSHAEYHGGFFVENIFVLVNGYYEDKELHVSTMILPPGEEYTDSRPSFGNLNYFGGLSNVALKDSQRLKEHMQEDDMIMFFSDVWLDNPIVFEKLQMLFEGLKESPPVAFVFLGNFMADTCSSEALEILKNLFRQLGDLIVKYPNIVKTSQFVFVPGMSDPCMQHIVPRLPLPKFVTSEIMKSVPGAVFATNPCRIQYCTKEITVFRADIMTKLLQGTIHKPKKDELADCITRTIISQGHLSPMSLNALTVHWNFDYALQLYPLPDLIVIGDRSDTYQGKYKGCQVVNPGSLCDNGFRFKSYVPATDTLEDCVLEF